MQLLDGARVGKRPYSYETVTTLLWQYRLATINLVLQQCIIHTLPYYAQLPGIALQFPQTLSHL